jgi:hypothetical protein
VVQPRREHAIASQLAAVLVEVHVVRIVGPSAAVAKAPERPPFGEPAHDRAKMPVWHPRRPREHEVEVDRRERPALAGGGVAHGRLRRDPHQGGVELGEVDIDDVVPERVIQGRADDLGAAGHLRVRRRIELDLPGMAVRGGDTIARLNAFALAGRDRPVLNVDAVDAVGAANDLRHAHRLPTDAVDEPARIGHLVDGVDVHRRRVAPLARLEERVAREVEEIALVDLRRAAGVERAVIVRPDGIVGKVDGTGRLSRGKRQTGCRHD